MTLANLIIVILLRTWKISAGCSAPYPYMYLSRRLCFQRRLKRTKEIISIVRTEHRAWSRVIALTAHTREGDGAIN
ncbi:hypothetical protein F5J12DRAFT_856123 [Pisolithus orientalis]|uniref:uncharacterized protein n=1 Tax=Pisolithus orientalis TaxID=936130 RepID=UPI002224DE3F|nr:uncharacterized protein F5J12DRAFT_856123 [Pisolithus orientalis]KAI5995326.1 hypothetical protein F5J12DRAFT_856123 [Pisolithus orientalis]